MKRLFVLLLCALSLPALAAGKSSLTVETVPDVLAEKSTEESTKIVTGVRGAGETGKYSLAATYYEAGKPIYTEIIEFRSAGEQPMLVELLAFAPQQRNVMLNGYKNHSVTLEHPDGSVENLPFGQLLADSPDQLATGKVVVTPISVTSPKRPGSMQDLGAIFAASHTCDLDCCLNDCYLYYNQCESGCGSAPAEDCLLRCDSQLAACKEDCYDCPVVTEYWVTTLQSETFTGATKCLEDHQFSGGKVYKEMERTWKNTKYRETEECDGTTTTEVIDVTYSVDYCWKRTSNVCFAPDPNSQFYCQY